MDPERFLWRASGFQWDQDNVEKSRLKHRVSPAECEQVFFNRPLVAAQDLAHFDEEDRYFCLGQTDAGRFLFLAFTLRDSLIRVNSARDMSRRERKASEHDD